MASCLTSHPSPPCMSHPSCPGSNRTRSCPVHECPLLGPLSCPSIHLRHAARCHQDHRWPKSCSLLTSAMILSNTTCIETPCLKRPLHLLYSYAPGHCHTRLTQLSSYCPMQVLQVGPYSSVHIGQDGSMSPMQPPLPGQILPLFS